MPLELHAETHTYTRDGKVLPSVTEVLALITDFSKVNPAVLEAAREFGEHVHQAINFYNRGALDQEALDPELLPYVLGWQKFLEESGAVVIASEQPVAHPTLGYAGTPDLVLSWGKRVVIPDIKATATVPATVGPQTAAYAQAYAATYSCRPPQRYCIHLTPNQYRSHVRVESSDWSIFLSCLNIFQWRKRNGI